MIKESISKDYYQYNLYKIKAELYETLKTREETIACYQDIANKFKEDMDAVNLLGEYYYYQGLYEEAVDYFLMLSNKYPESTKFDSWIIFSYDCLGEYDKVLEYGTQRIEKGRASALLYNAIGYSFTNQTLYMESLEYFDKAIEMDPEGEDPYFNKLYALYYGKRYKRCIEFAKQIQDKFTIYDIPAYIADCYYSLGDYKQAIIYYDKALQLSPEHDGILAELANSYYMDQDNQRAEYYANQCLEFNSSNYTAQSLMKLIKDRSMPMGSQLKDFFKDKYLYYTKNSELEERMEALLPDLKLSNKEIESAIEQLKEPEDSFTFLIYNDMYEYLKMLEEEKIETHIEDDRVYIRIAGFYMNTDNHVIEVLDSIANSEEKTLILDLRENYGGLTYAANNILDALLPSCVTCTTIDRNGYTYNYYSDASYISFQNIYILVNENSASAAELLTLGLKTYLKNVTIIGAQTYGKGVGQIVYEDQKRRLMVYVVDSYWNVRQQNIMDTGVQPDIYVKSEKLEDYLNKIEKNKLKR